ncbi:MAG: DNA translocase FtsK 4TM domain-containing protein [Bryobacterales bacterium]|nr:DNA translocase FtsK 4TM domain-containing protein [Bryobacterales bacterium]
MNILGPTPLKRLNEAVGIVWLFGAIFTTLALISYYPQDPSWNTATADVQARNLVGSMGAHFADFAFQAFGLAAFAIPAFLLGLAWNWIRSNEMEAQWAKVAGVIIFWLSVSALFGLGPDWRLFEDSIAPGGLVGGLLAQLLLYRLNLAGSVLLTTTVLLLSLYLLSSFSLYHLPNWMQNPLALFEPVQRRWFSWLGSFRKSRRPADEGEPEDETEDFVQPTPMTRRRSEVYTESGGYEIPIRTLDDVPPGPVPVPAPSAHSIQYAPLAPTALVEPDPEPEADPDPPVVEYTPPQPTSISSRPPWEEETETVRTVLHSEFEAPPPRRLPLTFKLPSTTLLNEPEAKSPYDAQELKETAVRIKEKFQEFNVLGNVTQINPGPVVTTFEFKPEAGIKYSRITTLTEDLCLGLQAESILIERIPGKPTVGIEVPNSRREVIGLRQILESDEFNNSPSKLTIALGKDISGRIKVAPLEAMPHLLIAGSTGSGKSVMLNSLIMSVIYKASPQDVRMILIDPKRVEMGLYEDIPHLLTPVVTDPRKATNALRNAVLEMERRLKLLASVGVRNIDQFNKKVKQKAQAPRSLFDDGAPLEDELQPLSYILIVIDELADLMMIERQNVEESITRLAQMARAVGMHLVVATQRPSVDVITGLIKANFPARISFRVATRVDSRTILDVMGAEHLLGKGDMLFLPPGSARLVRVHAAYVSEGEISQVTEFWKDQARPDYDQSYLLTPPDDKEEGEEDDFADFNDPAYDDAVRVICEVGKASTSVLQRRLRLGYGRAARILDKMQYDGIIGPPDGPRPRDVLKRPDWLDDIKEPVR